MHVPLCFSAECWEPVEESAKGPKKSHRQRWAARRRNHKESQKVHTHTHTHMHKHKQYIHTCIYTAQMSKVDIYCLNCVA